LLLINVAISIWAYNSLKRIPNPGNNSGQYSWTLVLKDVYYEMIRALIGLASTTGLFLFILLTFADIDKVFINLPKFTIPALENINSKIQILTLFYLWIAYETIRFIVIFIKYKLLNKIQITDSFAENQKLYLIWKKKMDLITLIPLYSSIILILIFIGIPPFILSPFVIILIVIFFIEKKWIRSLNTFSYDENSKPLNTPRVPDYLRSAVEHNSIDRNSSENVTIYDNEGIRAVVYGTMRVAPDLKSVFSIRGWGGYGVGSYIDRENSLIVTNNRFLLIEIPVTGGHTIVGDLNYTQENLFYNRKEIREKGEIYIQSKTLDQLVKEAVRNYLFTNIKAVRLNTYSLTIEFLNGDKYKCSFLDKEYKSLLQETLSNLLVNRLTVK